MSAVSAQDCCMTYVRHLGGGRLRMSEIGGKEGIEGLGGVAQDRSEGREDEEVACGGRFKEVEEQSGWPLSRSHRSCKSEVLKGCPSSKISSGGSVSRCNKRCEVKPQHSEATHLVAGLTRIASEVKRSHVHVDHQPCLIESSFRYPSMDTQDDDGIQCIFI